MHVFDPKFCRFSWPLAEQQLRRESITDGDRILRDVVIAQNVDIEKCVKKIIGKGDDNGNG